MDAAGSVDRAGGQRLRLVTGPGCSCAAELGSPVPGRRPDGSVHNAIEDRRITSAALRALLTLVKSAAVLAVTRDAENESYGDFVERIATCA